MPHAHRLRLFRSHEPGRAYLCTSVAFDREPAFAEFSNGRSVVHAMREMDARSRTTTLAFVVMPDHLHWLFVLGEGERLDRVIGNVRQRSTHAINAATGRRGMLWQRGFHDHAVRADEDLRAIARYIVFNPVRAGLVRSVREYPLWDACWL